MKFEPPDTHYLIAAEGWLELGNPVEASEELKQIAPALQRRPEVLAIRWQIYAKDRNWKKCVEVGESLVETSPELVWGWIHRSYALHELGHTREAFEALLSGMASFPKEWLVQYNLACYCCRLGEMTRALHFLEEACKLGNAKEIKAMASKDADLRELWERL